MASPLGRPALVLPVDRSSGIPLPLLQLSGQGPVPDLAMALLLPS